MTARVARVDLRRLARAALPVLKPTLAPFALIGIRTRSWWAVTLGLGFVSLAMLPDWFEYLSATTNLTGQNLTYSMMHLPLTGIGIVAWLGRRRATATGTT